MVAQPWFKVVFVYMVYFNLFMEPVLDADTRLVNYYIPYSTKVKSTPLRGGLQTFDTMEPALDAKS